METSEETSLQQKLTMPTRWKNVHDCERPSRWREQVRGCSSSKSMLEVDTYGCSPLHMATTFITYGYNQLDDEDCKVRLEQLKSGAASDDGQARA